MKGTPIHPIWSLDRGDWVPLGEMEPGETLASATGPATLLSTTTTTRPTPVYNLEINRHHVYQVGNLAVLVHNSCPSGAAVEEAIENGTLFTRRLRNNSRIHHIASDKDKIFTPQFEKLFKEGGLDLQSAWNRTRVPNHVGPHGKFYNNYVLERLQTAVAGKSGTAYRKALLDELYQLRREIQNGDLGDLLRAGASLDDVMRNF